MRAIEQQSEAAIRPLEFLYELARPGHWLTERCSGCALIAAVIISVSVEAFAGAGRRERDRFGGDRLLKEKRQRGRGNTDGNHGFGADDGPKLLVGRRTAPGRRAAFAHWQLATMAASALKPISETVSPTADNSQPSSHQAVAVNGLLPLTLKQLVDHDRPWRRSTGKGGAATSRSSPAIRGRLAERWSTFER